MAPCPSFVMHYSSSWYAYTAMCPCPKYMKTCPHCWLDQPQTSKTGTFVFSITAISKNVFVLNDSDSIKIGHTVWNWKAWLITEMFFSKGFLTVFANRFHNFLKCNFKNSIHSHIAGASDRRYLYYFWTGHMSITHICTLLTALHTHISIHTMCKNYVSPALS